MCARIAQLVAYLHRAEIYHMHTYRQSVQRLRIACLVFNLVVVAAQIAIWILVFTYPAVETVLLVCVCCYRWFALSLC